MSTLLNPLDRIPGTYLEATDGPNFAVHYGWCETEKEIPPNLSDLLEETWKTAFAFGESKGQSDGVTYKSERLTEVTNERDKALAKSESTDAANRDMHDAMVRLEAEKEDLKGELREAAQILRKQNDALEDNKVTITALTDSVMTYADVMKNDREEREELEKSVRSGKEAQATLASVISKIDSDRQKYRTDHENRPLRRLGRGLNWLSLRIEARTDIK